MRRIFSLLCIELSLVWLLPAQQGATARPAAPASAAAAKPAAQGASAPAIMMPGGVFKFTANTEIVLVNLTVKDSKGNPIKDLKPTDVTVYEDGKRQSIASFEFENVDSSSNIVTAANGAGDSGPSTEALSSVAPVAKKPAAAASSATAAAASQNTLRDRRLFVLYFDLTTMQPEDVVSAVESAQNYVKKQMQPADLVAIATLGDSLQINQDFTGDKDALNKVLNGLNPNTGAGFAQGGDGTTDGTADDGNSFAVDDSEFNVMNTDRSLEGLMQLADMLASIPQKKSVLYFASGIEQTGADNEIVVRSAVNAAVKANVSFYTVDPRGLQALPPGGSANTASIRGNSSYSGGSTLSSLSSNFSQDETISTLATDTGGRSFLDTSDFSPVYSQIQEDTQSYYLITYNSSDRERDGRYRKITVKVDRPDVKLGFRPGYYAARDINHLDAEDRSQQLQDELTSDVPEQSINIYATDGYLELDPHRYFVPVTLAIPGAQIPLSGVNAKATPTVDIAGLVYDQLGRQLAHVNGTIRLDEKMVGGATQQIQTKNLQWSTGFVLAPGQKYQLRFAARENQTGQLGAFQTVITIPDLDAQAAKMPSLLRVSSVIAGSQLTTVKPNPDDPLTETGTALVPSVTRVFSVNQHLYLYYEVYDPQAKGGNIDVKTDVAFYQGKRKAFESQLLSTEEVTDPKRNAAVIQIDIPLNQLKPGYYSCQVNAIDDTAGRFAFPRITILLRPPQTAAASSSSPGTQK